MKSSIRPAFLLLSLLLAGCASTTVPPTTPAPTYPDVTGNWQFNVQFPNPPNFTTSVITSLSGSLASSGATVTGVLRARALTLTPCVSTETDIPVTGTVDHAGNLSLTAPISKGTATLSVTANALLPILTGTFQVDGGACTFPAGNLSAAQIGNLTGTYTGTLTQVIIPPGSGTTPAPTLAVTASLTQSATPDGHGVYPLTGTITTTGACTSTIPITNGIVTGETVQSIVGLGSLFALPFGTPFFNGAAAPAPVLHQNILGSLMVSSACSSATFSGFIARP